MTKKENLKKLFTDKKTRNILIPTGLVVLLVGAVAATSMKKEEPELPPDLRGVRQVSAEAVAERNPGEMDPAYKQKFDEQNNRRAEEAEAAGKTAFLTLGDDVVAKTPPPEPPKKAAETKPLDLQQSGSLNSAPTRRPTDGKVHPAIGALMKHLDSGTEAKKMTVHHAFATPETVEEPPLLAATATSESDKANVQAVVYYAAGTIAAATFVNKLDSYNPGDAIATIHSGPLAGGKLIGKAAPGTNGVGMKVSFNTLALKDGRSYRIQAVGLAENDLSSLIASDVDHKIFNRFVLRPVAYFAQGMAEAVLATASASKITSNDNTGLIVQEQAKLDTKEQVRVGVGKSTEELVKELDKAEYLTPRTTVQPQEVFGVMFLQTVTNESLINLETK